MRKSLFIMTLALIGACASGQSWSAEAQAPAPAIAGIVDAADTAVDATVTIDSKKTIGVSQFSPGYTFNQCTLRADKNQCGRDSVDPTAAAAAERLLSSLGKHFANVQMYGWGVDNPEPAPNRYDLASLTDRLNIIRRTGGTPVITFCCSPDWMSGGAENTSYTDAMYNFPTPDHYDQFAALAAKIAADNRDVKYFQMWNEFKGLYATNGSYDQWDYVSYTTLYNKVYDAVKRVRPDAKIGGPYPSVDAWTIGNGSNPSNVRVAGLELDERPLDATKYWLRYKHGADFIALDASNGAKDVGERGHYAYSGYSRCELFASATHWVRALSDSVYPGAKTLPILWSEWYAYPSAGGDDRSTMAQCLIPTITSGASAALIWGPEGQGATGDSTPMGWWTGTVAGGGKATAFYTVVKGVVQYFPPGTRLYQTTVTGAVGALSSSTTTMLVNHSKSKLRVRLNKVVVTLPGYGVQFVDNATGRVHSL